MCIVVVGVNVGRYVIHCKQSRLAKAPRDQPHSKIMTATMPFPSKPQDVSASSSFARLFVCLYVRLFGGASSQEGFERSKGEEV